MLNFTFTFAQLTDTEAMRCLVNAACRSESSHWSRNVVVVDKIGHPNRIDRLDTTHFETVKNQSQLELKTKPIIIKNILAEN